MVISASTRPSHLQGATGLHPSMLADWLQPRSPRGGDTAGAPRLDVPVLQPVAAHGTVADRARVAQRLLAYGSW